MRASPAKVYADCRHKLPVIFTILSPKSVLVDIVHFYVEARDHEKTHKESIHRRILVTAIPWPLVQNRTRATNILLRHSEYRAVGNQTTSYKISRTSPSVVWRGCSQPRYFEQPPYGRAADGSQRKFVPLIFAIETSPLKRELPTQPHGVRGT